MLNIILALLIGFSYKIMEQIILSFSEKRAPDTIYFWGIWLLFASLFYKGNYIYNLPVHVLMSLPLVISVILVSFILGKHFTYVPESKRDKIIFIGLNPILQEIAFRGIILPMLMQGTALGSWVTPLNVIMLSPAILLSAVIYAAASISYARWKKGTISSILIIFISGVLYGIVAQVTRSVLFPIMMHISFKYAIYHHSQKKLDMDRIQSTE